MPRETRTGPLSGNEMFIKSNEDVFRYGKLVIGIGLEIQIFFGLFVIDKFLGLF